MKKEIVSFNETVPDVASMLELDGPALELLVVGGLASKECPNLTSCQCFGNTICNLDVSI